MSDDLREVSGGCYCGRLFYCPQLDAWPPSILATHTSSATSSVRDYHAAAAGTACVWV